MAFNVNTVAINDGGGGKLEVVTGSSNTGRGSRSYAGTAKNPVVEPDYSPPATSYNSTYYTPPGPTSYNGPYSVNNVTPTNSISYVGFYTSPANVSSLNSSNNSGNNNNNSGGFFSKLSGWVSGWGSNDNKKSNTTTSYTPPPGPTSYNGPYLANNNSSGGSTTTGGYYTNPANNNSPYLVNKNLASPQQPASTYAASYNNPSVIPDNYKTGGKVLKSADLLQSVAAFGEGIVKALEWLGDAMYYSYSQDAAYQLTTVQAAGTVFGNEKLANTAASASQYMSDPGRIAETIAADYTDMAFDAIYSTKGMSAINNSTSKFLYRDASGVNTGLGYSVLKKVGAYTPAIVASSVGGPLAQGSVVAAMSYGENLESNCQVLVDNADKNGQDVGIVDFAIASGKAGLSATVDGSIVYGAGMIKGPVSVGLNSLGLNNVVANHCGADASILVKSLKPFVNEAIDTFVYKEDSDSDGKVDKYDWKACGVEAVSIVAAEKVSNLIGNILGNFKSSNTSSTPSLPVGSTIKPNTVEIPKITAKNDQILQFLTRIADNKIATDIVKRIGKETTSSGIGALNK